MKGSSVVFQQLDVMEGDWRKSSQGGRSKAREVPESKRRTCFKEDRTFNGVKFHRRGVEVFIGLATWKLLAIVERAVSEDRGKGSQTGKCYSMSEWGREVAITSVDHPLRMFYSDGALGGS